MQKKLLKFSPYLVLIIVFTVASVLLAWDINTTQRNTKVSIFLLREKGIGLLQSLESNLVTIPLQSTSQITTIFQDYAERDEIEFIALTDEEGKVIISSDTKLVGEFLPIESPFSLLTKKQNFIVSNKPFTKRDIIESTVFLVQKHLFSPRLQHNMGEFKHKNNFKQRQRHCLNTIKGLCNSDSILFITVGFNTQEIMKAKLIDDRKSLINLLAFTFLILLGSLSFYLLKKYQQSYELIEQSKVYFDGLMKTIPLGIITTTKDLEIVTINPVAEKLLGKTSYLNKNILEFLPSLAHLDFEKQIKNLMIKTQEQQHCSIELNTFIIVVDNETKGIGFVLRDMQEIIKLQEELTRKDKLASIGQLAAGIAHEIRNPLSSIKGFARIFEENAKEGSEEKQLAEIMNQEILRVDKVISDLFGIAKPNALTIDSVSLLKVIEKAQNAVILDAKKLGIKFVNEIKINDITLDADRMVQILHNIFINAIEAMPKGGTITVKAETAENSNIIKISDTGIGIAEDKLSKLFTPYYTTKAKGTGLGLVIVQKIIEAHDGTIQVESKENIGTTFIIRLPR